MIEDEILKAHDLQYPAILTGEDHLPSCFEVTELAANSIGAVGATIALLLEGLGLVSMATNATVDRRLASLWFSQSIQPISWEMPPTWDAIAGEYEANDGWIKLHTNFSHHKDAALSVLECKARRSAVAQAVKSWAMNDLESAIVNSGGVAAAMRSRTEWARHSQGAAIAREPVIGWTTHREGQTRLWRPSRERPLDGLRVLDLTRVLAGPVATRTLAGFGASVLRVDPYGWEEPNVVPEITLGKRCCRLDLTNAVDREAFEGLLSGADILVHGYRPGALEGLGLGPEERLNIAPKIIEAQLDAYGWAGPWRGRRGFDSLVQMSNGIADAGMKWAQRKEPTPLPVQALDHATGYLLAAAVIGALDTAIRGNGIANAQLSLARTAELLAVRKQDEVGGLPLKPRKSDFLPELETTPWGDAYRLRPPIRIEGTPMHWQRPACELGSSRPGWH